MQLCGHPLPNCESLFPTFPRARELIFMPVTAFMPNRLFEHSTAEPTKCYDATWFCGGLCVCEEDHSSAFAVTNANAVGDLSIFRTHPSA